MSHLLFFCSIFPYKCVIVFSLSLAVSVYFHPCVLLAIILMANVSTLFIRLKIAQINLVKEEVMESLSRNNRENGGCGGGDDGGGHNPELP